MSLQDVFDMPASEIVIWQEYFAVVPFSEERADLRAAMLIQSVWNASGRTLKDTHLMKTDDFLPDFWQDNEPESVEQQQVDADKSFALNLLATGLGKMQNGT